MAFSGGISTGWGVAEMASELLSLDRIGLNHGTDKASYHHDYLSFYERFFAARRGDAIKLLEIGVFNGASLAVWEEYFPNAQIVGADINPLTRRFQRPRVAVEIIDQSNLDDLAYLAAKHGPFDIVIEDGSHLWGHQIASLRALFPFVRPGGLYVVEDLQTNYGAMEADFRGYASISCVEYLKKLVDYRVADVELDIAGEEDAFLRSFGRGVDFIAFYRRACLIEKARRTSGRWHSNEEPPIVPTRHGDAEDYVSFAVHVGDLGDLASQRGLFVVAEKMKNIQGFRLQASGPFSADLSCRARLADGTWSEWSGVDGFVGTRGQSRDLTGFSVRLTGPSLRTYDIAVGGVFRRESAPVVVGNGEPCEASTAGAALYGMQIVLRSRGQG